jgi:trigger factor
MLTKNIEKQPKSVVVVSITAPWADLEAKWNDTLTRLGAEVEVPGFRKGTAPVNMVETQLGAKLQDEFLKVVMPELLIEALKGSDIVPIDYPKYDVVSFTKGTDLQFKATVTNRPTINIGNYKVIKVSKPTPKEVPEEEVAKVINDLFKRWQARQTPTAAPQANQPQTATGGTISFQGAPAAPASPAGGQGGPDDTFAKAMGAADLNDLQAKIKKDLVDHASYNNELDYEESILQEVEKMTSVELPEILIEDELNRMLVSLQRRVADMGLLLEDYLKNQNKTLEQLKNEWRAQAEKNVRMELGLAEIAKMENVSVSDEDLQAEIDKIQDERVKRQFEAEEPRMHLRHALRQTRTLNLLKGLVSNG